MFEGDWMTAEERDLIGRAWPHGPDMADLAILRALPPLRRSKVMARLRAVVEIEEARRDNPRALVDLRRKAGDAGLTPDGLFAIRRKWEAERRLRSLVPYLGRAERQPTQRADDDPVVVAARELLRDMADAPDSRVASALRGRFDLSLPVLIRLVRRLRRDDATDADRIGAVFGRSLLVDLCAFDRAVAGDPPQSAVCAMVVERASGLVLGHSVVAANGDTLAAQAAAVEAARGFLSRGSLDRADGDAGLQLTLGDGSAFEAAVERADALRRDGVDLGVNSVGPRRYGTRLVSLLGKRLGRLWWRPRSTSPDLTPPDVADDAAMTLANLATLVDAEVVAHNGDVMARLAEGGVGRGWGVPAGAMAAALGRTLSVLAP